LQVEVIVWSGWRRVAVHFTDQGRASRLATRAIRPSLQVWQLPAVAFGASIVLFWRAVRLAAIDVARLAAANDVSVTVGLFRGEFCDDCRFEPSRQMKAAGSKRRVWG